MEKQFNRPHRFCPKLASTKILPITGNQVSDCLRLQLLSKFWLSIVNSACGFGYRQHLSRDNLAFQSFTKYVWPGTSKEKMLRQRWSLDSSRFCLLSGFVSSVRSSNSHPDLLVITSTTTTTTPLFQIHTGPQHWTFTFWATTAI